MTARQPTFEFPEMKPEPRLGELILYIAEVTKEDRTFGKVKLAKVLYFADFIAYRDYGQPITGAKYRKLEKGPVPDLFSRLLEKLEKRGDIIVRSEPYFDRELHRIVALREPDLTKFSGRDIALIDRIIRDFWGRSAAEISELSHDIGWKIVDLNEAIPYEAAILSDEEITAEDIALTHEIIEEHGREI